MNDDLDMIFGSAQRVMILYKFDVWKPLFCKRYCLTNGTQKIEQVNSFDLNNDE